MSTRSAAQNQHYVPKFILRNFLSNAKKEQVNVFSKKSAKGFTTSIRNIMAERRFHEFAIGEDYLASFEDSICRIEDILLPAYRKIIEKRRLDGTTEQKTYLAMLMAFQFLRTRSQRDQIVEMEQQLDKHLKKHGANLRDIKGYVPLTDDLVREHHIRFIQNATADFASVISAKDIFLLQAPKGRRFYLSDTPVTIHNSQPKNGIFGNLGLSCQGIEIYMPLTSNLQLCAWCPSLLHEIRSRRADSNRKLASLILSREMMNVRDKEAITYNLNELKTNRSTTDEVVNCVDSGIPLVASNEIMDFQNALQVDQAREHLICEKADFDLARRFMSENPESQGLKLSTL